MTRLRHAGLGLALALATLAASVSAAPVAQASAGQRLTVGVFPVVGHAHGTHRLLVPLVHRQRHAADQGPPASRPAYLHYLGRPVVFIYNPAAFSTDYTLWSDIIHSPGVAPYNAFFIVDSFDYDAAAVFDGIYRYEPFGPGIPFDPSALRSKYLAARGQATWEAVRALGGAGLRRQRGAAADDVPGTRRPRSSGARSTGTRP